MRTANHPRIARGIQPFAIAFASRNRFAPAMNGNLDLDEKKRPELTFRGLVIGVIITLVFTAANVYAGLKAALTFSTSIPAAVISMAILRSSTASKVAASS